MSIHYTPRFVLFWSCLLLFWLVSSSFAMSKKPPRPPIMGVLGDSIPSATLAETHLLSSQSLQTQDIQAQAIIENKDTLSWASGKLISSHYLRLKDALDAPDLVVANLAVPGAKAHGLLLQARLLVTLLKTGKYQELKYIALMIGANDVCSKETDAGTPNDKMSQDLYTTFQIIAEIQQKGPIRILVSSIPRIPDLGNETIRESRTIGGLRCETVRNTLGICSYQLKWETHEDYLERVEIVKAKNEVLADTVHRANQDFKNLDIVFTYKTFESAISSDILAADCFHPNKKGHELLSEGLWTEQPWFR